MKTIPLGSVVGPVVAFSDVPEAGVGTEAVVF